MNWDAIGAVAELLGGIGVIASLVYLSVQIRQNTNSVRAAAAREVLHEAQRILIQISSDPELAELNRRGGADRSSLSDAERYRFDTLVLAALRNGESLFIQSKRGVLSDADWDGLRETIRLLLRTPGFQESIAEGRSQLNRDFALFLDSLINSGGGRAA